jgi:hypothetical protein
VDDAVTHAAGSGGAGPFPIEIDVPRLARVRDAINGGEANFPVDREVVAAISDATPVGLEGLRGVIEALHRFRMRVVRTIADESDVRQFLHVGTATPTTGMVHEHLLPLVPDARVVYTSYDATTLAHVHELGVDTPDGAVAHVRSRFEDSR